MAIDDFTGKTVEFIVDQCKETPRATKPQLEARINELGLETPLSWSRLKLEEAQQSFVSLLHAWLLPPGCFRSLAFLLAGRVDDDGREPDGVKIEKQIMSM